MFDIGFQELLVIGAAAVICIPPKDLPGAMRTVMGVMRKAKQMAGEFHQSIQEVARQADLQDMKKQLTDLGNVDPQELIERGLDPGGELRREIEHGATPETVASADGAEPVERDRPL
jgi:sec-independent protein translocase protein TatB